MIKTMVFVKRKPDISFKVFCDYWVNSHGPLTAKLPGLSRLQFNLVRPEFHWSPPEWDGVSCAWFKDEASLRAVTNSSAFQAMLTDEENFVDTQKRSPMIVAPMAKMIDPSARWTTDSQKTIFGFRRQSGVTRASFNTYWGRYHAKRINNLPHLMAYVQNTIQSGLSAVAPLYDAIAECYWDSWDGAMNAVRSEAYKDVEADEICFADLTGCAPLVVREVEIVSNGKLIV